jgi:hypothetical protein
MLLTGYPVPGGPGDGLADVAYAPVDSPVGELMAAVTRRGLVRLAYEDGRGDAVLGGRLDIDRVETDSGTGHDPQLRMSLDAARYPMAQWSCVYEQIGTRVASIPGVTAASLVNRGLMEDGMTRSGPIHYPGYTFKPGESYGVDDRSLVLVRLVNGQWKYEP